MSGFKFFHHFPTPSEYGQEFCLGMGGQREKLLCFAGTITETSAVPKWRVFDAVGGSVNGSRNSYDLFVCRYADPQRRMAHDPGWLPLFASVLVESQQGGSRPS